MKKREITIPTIIGLFLALGGLVSGLWLVRSQLNQNVTAYADETPKEVRITNITDDSFTVSWITDKAVTGFVQYAESSSDPDKVVSDDRDQQKAAIESYFTHHVTLKGLKPATIYKFRIGSGKNLYDQEGLPYQTETAQTLAGVPAADVAYGQVNNQNGDPAEGAIVYLQIPGTVLQSTLVKTSGSWVIPIATARKYDLTQFAVYDTQKERINIDVQGGRMGKSSVVVTTANDSPVRNIVLGEDANLVTDTGELVILAPQSGEKVNTITPEIIGRAPAGATVSVEINSPETIKGETVADSMGNFSFSIPKGLTPGEHTVSVTTIVNGLAKTVTKSFTVYAAGESNIPSYSATPSASMAPKPTAKASPTPTKKPAITPSPTMKPTSAPLPTATVAPPKPTAAIIVPSPTPVTQLENSGEAETTWLILLLGTGFIFSGAWWYRKAA